MSNAKIAIAAAKACREKIGADMFDALVEADIPRAQALADQQTALDEWIERESARVSPAPRARPAASAGKGATAWTR